MSAAAALAPALRRWRRDRALAAVLWGLALAAPMAALFLAAGLGIGAVVGGAVAGGVACGWTIWRGSGRAGIAGVARHLDRAVPALQESGELLLDEPSSLSPLARLQRARIERVLAGTDLRAAMPRRPLRRALGAAVVGAAIATAIAVVGASGQAVGGSFAVPADAGAPGAETGPPEIDRIVARVVPPRYTGLPEREVEGLSIAAPVGSRISWRVEVRGEVDEAAIETAESLEPLAVERAAAVAVLTGETAVESSRLHRIVLRRDGEVVLRSPYGRLEAVPDRAPELAVVAPERSPVTAADEVAVVPFAVEARDDYGLGDAELVVTVAAGRGEMVTFRERRRPLPVGAGERSRSWRFGIDLADEGAAPGSELYVQVVVRDRRAPEPQTARTPTVVIRVPGGSGESVGLGGGIPVVMPPEMFRSQRQIILDTEQLLSEASGLTRDELVRRSEALGLDQRALRLRYGVLLGDEFESGAPVGVETDGGDDHDGHGHPADGDGHDDGAAPGPPRRTGEGAVSDRFAAIPEGLAHRHDSAESATFFPDEIRATLKAALAAMWDAEGRLRGVEPAAALPFENTALRLLKEVQQRSRVYVQRVGFAAPPLVEAERRLKGDLSEIRDQLRRWSEEPAEGPDLAAAYAALAEDPAAPELRPALVAARAKAATAALADADRLADVEALDALIAMADAGDPIPDEAAAAAGAALWSLMPPPEGVPRRDAGSGGALGRRYRELLAEGDGR